MTLALSFWLFFASSALFIISVYTISDPLLILGTIIISFTAVHIGIVMGLRLYLYTASLFIFHLFMTIITVYIYLNRDLVIPTTIYIFSTFTDENLRTALIVLVTALMVIPLPWLLMVRSRASILKTSPKKALMDLIGVLDFLKKGWIQAILLVSFLSAVVLFFTNTTVLEVSYPYNGRSHWIPYTLLKIPTLLAAIVIVACYFKYVHYGVRYYLTLNIARFNFVITPILMLMLVGGRGYFVFSWLFAGILEFYLFLKRRGSLFWAIIFIALAYFAFQSWPYLRWNLSLIPVESALSESLNIALFRSESAHSSVIDKSGMHIQDFTMVGASVFHLLYVIQLIQDGVSLGGSTFINLIPQSLPSFLDGIFWDRPLNDNWKLGHYYIHGGGFLAVANAYWNGGLLVTMIFMIVLSILFVGFDRYFINNQKSLFYKVGYGLLLPIIITQMGYGIQGLVRGIEILAIIILIDKIKKLKRF